MAFSTTRELTTPSAKQVRHTGTWRRPRVLFEFNLVLATIDCYLFVAAHPIPLKSFSR